MRSALVLGATGLVGGHVVRGLLEEVAYDRVVVLSRRPICMAHPKLDERQVDFDRLEEAGEAFAVDEIYCCLGTTIKRAGSQAAFRRVDHDYPLAAARLGLAAGAKRYLLVSAMGADPRSSVFYSRVKGEVEQAVAGLGYEAVQIFRPSLLLGHRLEFRLGEQVAAVLMRAAAPLMLGPLARARAIEGRTVAQAMIRVALQEPVGVRRYQNDEIQRIGN